MYHNQSQTLLKSTAMALILGASMAAVIMPAPASASVYKQGRSVIKQASVDTLRGTELSRIDWTQPEMKLGFDLSASDWIDGIELMIAMDPEDGARRDSVILVSLNNAPPVTLRPQGNSFDARISLDSDYARPSNNVITIRVPSADGAPCLQPSDGAWSVNTAKSSLIVRTRAKSRALYLNEVEDRLSNPVLAPKTVGIVARGGLKDRFEVLAAQGIGLRVDALPSFRMASGQSDMDVVIGRRDEISRLVNDRAIIAESGPKLSVDKGRPMTLVITGDTDAQVLSAAKLFSQYHLPNVRRSEASEGEMYSQRSFAQNHITLSGREKLGDLGFGYYARDWSGTPATLTFNVNDPMAQRGELTLRLSSSDQIAPTSNVDVRLNGRSLGVTALDKRRKTVAFAIPSGALNGADNTLSITPKFEKKAANYTPSQSCMLKDNSPGFFIGQGSKIEIKASGRSEITDLSRLAAGSDAFSHAAGADTHIVLATRTERDRGAALGVVAKLAQSAGTGWAEATVSSLSSRVMPDAGRNVMVIGPMAKATGLLDDAPTVLSTALRGQTAGGIAAVYPSSTQPGTLTAVISNSPKSRFVTTASELTDNDTWNDMSGSVVRWQGDKVLMAQTAIAAPNFQPFADPNAQSTGFDMASLDFAKWDTTWIEDRMLDMRDGASAAGTNLLARLSGGSSTPTQPTRTAAMAPAPVTETPVRLAEATVTQSRPQSRPQSLPQSQQRSFSQTVISQPTQRVAMPQIQTTSIKSPPMQKVAVERVPSTPIAMSALRGFSTVPSPEVKAPSLWSRIQAKFAPRNTTTTRIVQAPQSSPAQVLKTAEATLPEAIRSEFDASRMTAPPVKRWAEKAKAPVESAKRGWNTSSVEHAIRDVQFKLQPIGAKIKNTIGSDRNPIRSWMAKADRTVSYFGIMLAMAFVLSMLLLGIASPDSEDTKNY